MTTKKHIKNIAIIFGKEENDSFNRYTIPILGRPAGSYSLLAAINSEKIDQVYLSSDSSGLLHIGENITNVNLLKRENSQPTLTEEVRTALLYIISKLKYTPETVTILLANSPCITPGIIDNAVSFLEENPGYDSVVTTMKRVEFSSARIFRLNDNSQLKRNSSNTEPTDDEVYFLDRRAMVIRSEVILNSKIKNNYYESLLGQSIHPVIQEEGIWDIDYIWQVPIVESWLKRNGFNESDTPYNKVIKKKSEESGYLKQTEENNRSTNNLFNILITTIPFGDVDPRPLILLNEIPNVKYVINPIGRKLKEQELIELVQDYDIIIAGTEPITRRVIENGKKLKLISRVGIGLDSVDLHAANELGVKVSYTPDAPSPAVAELTIAQMLNMLRRVPLVDRKMRSGIWQRVHGERLSNTTVGIIGTGRVGSRVLKYLQGFGPKRIMVNDLKPDQNLYNMYHAKFVDKETIYKEADVISLHVPLTSLTYNMIAKNQIEMMKKNVCLINTSRGGIINERDLYEMLLKKRISSAAIDVFENEPYSGNLIELDNCLLTCHMGSMTNDCRAVMEIQATEEVCRFIKNEQLKQLVPKEEYLNVWER
ncbi:MAG: NAD(P)-dependent oxidoreductase [Melioribacteraceae bacterium]|nr:NAD(P)-dependent oxidoreductase [Melioribacteraceae bacterium]